MCNSYYLEFKLRYVCQHIINVGESGVQWIRFYHIMSYFWWMHCNLEILSGMCIVIVSQTINHVSQVLHLHVWLYPQLKISLLLIHCGWLGGYSGSNLSTHWITNNLFKTANRHDGIYPIIKENNNYCMKYCIAWHASS